MASLKEKRVFALARDENFACVTAFAIVFWKFFSGGSLGKYSYIGCVSFFFNRFRDISFNPRSLEEKNSYTKP